MAHIKLEDYFWHLQFSYVLIFLVLNFEVQNLSNLVLSLLQGRNPSDYCNCFSPHKSLTFIVPRPSSLFFLYKLSILSSFQWYNSNQSFSAQKLFSLTYLATFLQILLIQFFYFSFFSCTLASYQLLRSIILLQTQGQHKSLSYAWRQLNLRKVVFRLLFKRSELRMDQYCFYCELVEAFHKFLGSTYIYSYFYETAKSLRCPFDLKSTKQLLRLFSPSTNLNVIILLLLYCISIKFQIIEKFILQHQKQFNLLNKICLQTFFVKNNKIFILFELYNYLPHQDYKQLQKPEQKIMLKLVPIQKKLQQAHKGYAYELLELQMAVQDEKLSSQPSITQITRLIQLYMVGVEVLESIADPRFVYFHNKIHALMLKKHIVKKLHEASGQNMTDSINVANKAELKDKKDQYEINFFFNQGQVDIKKVQQMLVIADNKRIQAESKIKTDLKRQQDRLEQRIKIRKMRSQAGSVKKYNQTSQKQIGSPGPNQKKKQAYKDSRMQYFQITDQKYIDLLPKNKAARANSGSLQKIIFDRKYGIKKMPGSGDKQDYNDAI